MGKVATTDVYESCYYLINTCQLEAIEGVPLNGEITCKLIFSGERITDLQADYFRGTASVNLFNFRRTYSQVCVYIQQAKKKLKAELKAQAEKKGGGL
jgi:hypothetical protein